MKKYKVIKRIFFILWILIIIIMLAKNFNFFKSRFYPDSYEKVEARITDIIVRHNRVFNLRTEVQYSYKGHEETAQIFYTIGDTTKSYQIGNAANQKIWLMISDDGNITRNNFVFDWADLFLIVVLGLNIFVINKKEKEIRYQAAAQYAKKLYERQSEKEDSDIREIQTVEKVKKDEELKKDGVIINDGFTSDELTIGTIMSNKEKVAIVIMVILGGIILDSLEFYLLLLIFFIIYLGAFMLTLKDKLKARKEHKKDIIAEKRTCRLECTIIKVESELDPNEYIDYVRICCEHITAEGKRYQFKSDKVMGITECKIGDSISVLVEPGNYNNYYVQIQDVVHD